MPENGPQGPYLLPVLSKAMWLPVGWGKGEGGGGRGVSEWGGNDEESKEKRMRARKRECAGIISYDNAREERKPCRTE